MTDSLNISSQGDSGISSMFDTFSESGNELAMNMLDRYTTDTRMTAKKFEVESDALQSFSENESMDMGKGNAIDFAKYGAEQQDNIEKGPQV